MRRSTVNKKIVPPQQPQSNTFVLIRSSSQPTYKGKLVKGINYDGESLSIFSKAKIKEL